ncbi:MAG: hypothetical protein WA080_02525 [Sulfuricurvum sp.]
MSKNFAVVENGIVVNVIVADDEFVALYQEQNQSQLCIEYVESDINDENVARIGEHYVDGKFITPYVAPSIPASITMGQFRAILIIMRMGTEVQAVLDSIPDELQRELAQSDFEYRGSVERHHTLVEQFIASGRITEAEVDKFFIEGAKL